MIFVCNHKKKQIFQKPTSIPNQTKIFLKNEKNFLKKDRKKGLQLQNDEPFFVCRVCVCFFGDIMMMKKNRNFFTKKKKKNDDESTIQTIHLSIHPSIYPTIIIAFVFRIGERISKLTNGIKKIIYFWQTYTQTHNTIYTHCTTFTYL